MPIAAQDWCFVAKGESARELWERALAPMGLRLLAQVVRQAMRDGRLNADVQDPRFATRAPMTRKPVLQNDPTRSTHASLVVTVMGPDRPGIVRLLSDKAQRFGANWTDSRMARLAGEFAGMVHFEVPHDNAEALVGRAARPASRPDCGWRLRKANRAGSAVACAASRSNWSVTTNRASSPA